MGATTVACTSCRKALSGEEGRKVADWTFCASCFAALLEKPKAGAPKPAPVAAPASPSPSVQRGDARSP